MESNPQRVNVADIQGDERRCLESLLGQKLIEGQQVYIVAYTPGDVPDAETRRKALQRLKARACKVEAHAQRQGTTEQEIEEAIDEAAEQVRHGKP